MPPIRYAYSAALQPPAPFVHLTLWNVPRTAELSEQPAQVDTGADRTVLPTSMVDALGLLPVDEILVAGLAGSRHSLRTYAVRIGIRDLPPVLVEAFVSPEEPWILLGRDVLNAHRLLLDGPNLALEIG